MNTSTSKKNSAQVSECQSILLQKMMAILSSLNITIEITRAYRQTYTVLRIIYLFYRVTTIKYKISGLKFEEIFNFGTALFFFL